jgi:hypothetical protein
MKIGIITLTLALGKLTPGIMALIKMIFSITKLIYNDAKYNGTKYNDT